MPEVIDGVAWTKAQLAALEHLPARPRAGDVWEVGPHKVVVGSVASDGVLGELARGSYDVCWTDPPWDPGIGRTFRRQAGAGASEGDEQFGWSDVEDLFDALGALLERVEYAASVWTGLRAEHLSLGALRAAGMGDAGRTARAEVTYAGAPTPTPVWVGVRDAAVRGSGGVRVPPARSLADAVEGTASGRAQAAALLNALEPWVPGGGWHVVDPFCGQEVMASLLTRRDVGSLTGAELHPGRAARTIAAMARSTGQAPRLVAEVDARDAPVRRVLGPEGGAP